MSKRILGFVATGCEATGPAARPSLPGGVYDRKGAKGLSGTVRSLKFTTPHGSLALAVENQDGSSTGWITLGSATVLAQRGIGKTGPNALHTADEIKVKFLPAPDGIPPGFLKTVIVPGGAWPGSPQVTRTTNKEGGSSWLFYKGSLEQVSRSQSP